MNKLLFPRIIDTKRDGDSSFERVSSVDVEADLSIDFDASHFGFDKHSTTWYSYFTGTRVSRKHRRLLISNSIQYSLNCSMTLTNIKH